MDLEKYNVRDATHELKCSHCIGRSRHNYVMPCIHLSTTKSGMCKIVVFGDRDWKARSDKKRIRYVPPWRLIEKTKNVASNG